MKLPLRVSVNVTLREATAVDKDFAYQVKKAAFREYVEQVWGWVEADQRKLHDRRFQAENFTVINLNNVDIGTMYVTLEPDCVQVHQLYILPEHQGQGVGRACMVVVMDWASELGLPVRLRVLKVNPRAAALYERLGFAVTGETTTHLLMERSEEEPPEMQRGMIPGMSGVRVEKCDVESPVAIELIAALNAELDQRYPEEGANFFDLEPGDVAPDSGTFVVAFVDDAPAGCGAVRRMDDLAYDVFEIKRMFVVPSFRGRGIGKAVLAALETEARELGASRLVLEAGERQPEALALYESSGFSRIPRFGQYVNSPLSVCMGKELHAQV